MRLRQDGRPCVYNAADRSLTPTHPLLVSRCRGVKDDEPLTISPTELGAALQHLRPNGGLRELVADCLDDRGLYKLLVNQGRHLKAGGWGWGVGWGGVDGWGMGWGGGGWSRRGVGW